ncbi:hypothetical protein ACS0TY_015676 [Phlomoides rotata]
MQKRMIKNRESSKEAYTHELQNKVVRLEEEIERLNRLHICFFIFSISGLAIIVFLLKPPQSKHCHDCDKYMCILQFDNHCA